MGDFIPEQIFINTLVDFKVIMVIFSFVIPILFSLVAFEIYYKICVEFLERDELSIQFELRQSLKNLLYTKKSVNKSFY